MFTALYTAKSGMTVQQTNIDLHSHNLSNVSTTGFKRNFANIEDLAYQNYRQVGAAATEQNQLPTGLHMGLGARTVSIGRNFEQGSLQESKNSLDVAINGNGFFQVELPDGTTAYTRDGTFKLSAEGEVVTASGYRVLPGIAIQDPATRSITIAANGTVSAKAPNQRPTNIGRLKLVTPETTQALTRGDDGLLRILVGTIEDNGIKVVGAHQVVPELLAVEGRIGALAPQPRPHAGRRRRLASLQWRRLEHLWGLALPE